MSRTSCDARGRHPGIAADGRVKLSCSRHEGVDRLHRSDRWVGPAATRPLGGLEVTDIRRWATQTLQWSPARNGAKYAVHGYARARGHVLTATGSTPEVGTILGAGSQKAGSQWLKALLHHPVVRAHTGLVTLPQLDYSLTPPPRGFAAGTFVPGVYLTYDEYSALPKRHDHRVVYMVRDPRDVVISGYWSAMETHRKTHLDEVEELRARLRALPIDDALLVLIEAAAPTLRAMGTWMGRTDPEIAVFHLEQVEADYANQLTRILAHVGVVLLEAELAQVVADTCRATLQARDLADRGDGRSHYRLDRTDWRGVFTARHHEAMERVAPGLVEALGYHPAGAVRAQSA